ncbi:response regulator [Piscirickettsia litoralis]|uniref:Response regulatory domain-containing protein n=1 Tax=Piscirickettsia litoralis TaxID=1891921 RepID=A0ABX3A090_9GAMM|nr:response regulator [Piscirickettsia litoralis]ODN42286.1 hypothetical protein BGC07_04245 [Piscirickettsia litoralis]
MKVLLAEDSTAMADLECEVLRRLTHTPLSLIRARDGQEVMELIKSGEQQVDLIILDWHMPNCTGLDVLRFIRERDSVTPILMVTSESKTASIVRAVNEGVTEYIVKPFTVKDLSDKVSKYMID